jgi:uncharacterized protein (TIGR00252 family)
MTTFTAGRRAEATAAQYLAARGYQILERNWRTRYCEIDLVAYKDKTIYFIEVKYRATVAHGTGLEYITAAKLKQMGFAARMWVHNRQWRGSYALAALAVTGPDFTVTNFIVLGV